MKKLMQWSMRTELWLHSAFAVAVLLCPCALLSMLGKLPVSFDKGLALASLLLCIILSIRYRLFKRNLFWIYVAFFVWMTVQGIHEHVSLVRIIGDATQRSWYMCTILLILGYVLPKERRVRAVSVLLTVEIICASFLFSFAIINATCRLFNDDYVIPKYLGTFVEGRFSCCGNPNPTGNVAATLILISIWNIIYNAHAKRSKPFIGCLCTFGIFVGTIALGLTRSRGSIVATGIGIGVIGFVAFYHKEAGIKNFIASTALMLFATAFSCAILVLPKEIYDRVVTFQVSERVGVDIAAEVEVKLHADNLLYAINTMTDRTDIWPATIAMLNEKPAKWIWGYGSHDPNRKVFIYDVYKDRPEIMTVNSHSGYLQQLYMYGIPGAALLIILLVVWVIRAVKVAFASEAVLVDKVPIAIIAVALVNALVEIFLFPSTQIYPISLFLYLAVGLVSRQVEDRRSQKRIIQCLYVALSTLLGIVTVVVLSLFMYKRAVTKNDENIRLPRIGNFDINDYVKTDDYEYWDGSEINYLTDNEEPEVILKNFQEIARINYENRRMISTRNALFSQKEVGKEFYAKIAVELLDDIKIMDVNPEVFFVNGKETTQEFWNKLEKNADSESITSRISTKFGYSVTGTVLKRYPTDEKVYKKDSDFYYDEMAYIDLQPFTPVVILHESFDGEWVYVLTYGYGGWTRIENVALCRDREEWLERQEPESFIVVTGRELRLPTDPYHEELSDLSLPMGTKLPIVKLSDAPESIHDRISYGNYISVLPTRDEDGYIKDEYVLIPSAADVNLGYLPYTEENVAGLAFKHLGAGYGWAGDNLSQDCSGYVREVFACFGFELPRSAVAQSKLEYVRNIEVSKASDKEKLEILKDLPIGTLIYFPGHITIYLGMDNDIPYCISSVEDYSTKELGAGNVVEVNTVIITNMLDTTRGNGKTWLSAAERFVTP